MIRYVFEVINKDQRHIHVTLNIKDGTFCDNNFGLKPLTIFTKSFILDI